MTRKEEIENRIRTLINDMQAALEEALNTPDKKRQKEKNAEVQRIRREIQSYGYLVEIVYTAQIDPQNPAGKTPSAHINVYQPKENMTPEEQKIYNNWFLRQAGIKQTGDP